MQFVKEIVKELKILREVFDDRGEILLADDCKCNEEIAVFKPIRRGW